MTLLKLNVLAVVVIDFVPICHACFSLNSNFCHNSCNFPIFSMVNWTVNSNTVDLNFHLIQTFSQYPNSNNF